MTADGSVFTDPERRYLSKRRLGRIATVGRDGSPHVARVGWSYVSWWLYEADSFARDARTVD